MKHGTRIDDSVQYSLEERYTLRLFRQVLPGQRICHPRVDNIGAGMFREFYHIADVSLYARRSTRNQCRCSLETVAGATNYITARVKYVPLTTLMRERSHRRGIQRGIRSVSLT